MSKREGIMLCYPFEEKRLSKWNPPYIIQPKLDGERCRAIWSETHGYILVSSEFNTIVSVPHINKALERCYSVAELDGELYTHGLSFSEIHSRVSRTVNLHPNYEEIEFHIFDIINDEPQSVRLAKLYSSVAAIGSIKIVPQVLANTFDEVIDAYNGFLKDGYEGMIVRHHGASYRRSRSPYIMKFKPKKDDYYPIKGYSTELDKNGYIKLGMLGKIICSSGDIDLPNLYEYPPRAKLPKGYFGVGSGLTREQREIYWDKKEQLIGRTCHVAYQNITPGKGVPRFPVFLSVEE